MTNSISLAELNPDVNGDGKVDAHERKVFDMLKKADANNDGHITASELHDALTSFVAQQKKSSERRRMVMILSVAFVLILLANFGLMVAVVWMTKDTKADGAVLATMDNQVLQTGSAVTYLPLVAAAAMEMSRLAEVSAASVTFVKGEVPPFVERYNLLIPGDARVQKTYQVRGVTRLSPTAVVFSTSEPNQELLIADGKANITLIGSDGQITFSTHVCPGSVSCAALRIDGEHEEEELVHEHRRRLGLAPEDEAEIAEAASELEVLRGRMLGKNKAGHWGHTGGNHHWAGEPCSG